MISSTSAREAIEAMRATYDYQAFLVWNEARELREILDNE